MPALFVDGPSALAIVGLSIIDLGGGHQPMTDVGGRLWIVFNGEIYNYRALREELIGQGLHVSARRATPRSFSSSTPIAASGAWTP